MKVKVTVQYKTEHLCISINEIQLLIRLVITNINFTPGSATTTTKTTTTLRVSWFTKTKQSWNDTVPADYMTKSLDYRKEIQVNERTVQIHHKKNLTLFFLNYNQILYFKPRMYIAKWITRQSGVLMFNNLKMGTTVGTRTLPITMKSLVGSPKHSRLNSRLKVSYIDKMGHTPKIASFSKLEFAAVYV